MMRQRVIFVYSHESIGLGEDGPTHQPVEQLPGLRMIPKLSLWRPCDTVETAVAWEAALMRQGPTCLLLSRQTLPFHARHREQLALIAKGGYILHSEGENKPDAILIATGSEVSLAMEAAKVLSTEEINVRVVSIPSTDVFLAQDEAYRQTVLPDTVLAKVVIEAAASAYWYQFVGREGRIMGLDRFGASAPGKDVFRDCGFTVQNIVAMTKEVIYSAATSSHHVHAKCASGVVE